MSELANMTDEELHKEYHQLDELIHSIRCYGKRDVCRFSSVCRELDRREAQ